MAKRQIIVTGDKQLTKWLSSLERNTARKLHRTAARTAAKLVLAEAKSTVPKDTGKFAASLTVRALKRSRGRMGYIVVQKPNYGKPWKTGPGKVAFYGVFQEIGYTIGGRTRTRVNAKGMTVSKFKQAFNKAGKAKRVVKIPGKWAMRTAGRRKEAEAIRLYHSELERLLKAQGGTP